MAKFEAHITMPRENADTVQKAAEATGWTFSAIDGDPIMGKQAYCYLTAYDERADLLLQRMNTLSAAMQALAVPVLRRKIERIVFDSKTGVNELAFND